MVPFLKTAFFQKLLSSGMAFLMLTPALALAEETSLEKALPLSSAMSNDTQYFQDIANHWIPDKNATSPAVLKGKLTEISTNYRLDSGDTLTITIPGINIPDVDEANHLITPSSDSAKDVFDVVIRGGKAVIPPFGTFNVTGMTVPQLTDMVTEMARFYMVNPRVYIGLKSLRPYTVYINGAVRRPGSYQTLNAPEQAYLAYADNSSSRLDSQQFFESRISLMVSKAGGILPSADIEHVQVTNTETGRNLTLNLVALIDGDSSQDILLEPSDVVSIPSVKRQQYQSLKVAVSTLAPRQVPVHLIGYVNRSMGLNADGNLADITLEPNSMNLLAALAKVNVDPRANLRYVRVFRKGLDGKLEQYKVDALKNNFSLVMDDVIYVPHVRPVYQLQQIVATASQIVGVAGTAAVGVSTLHNSYWSNTANGGTTTYLTKP